jgi:hypothetical protein
MTQQVIDAESIVTDETPIDTKAEQLAAAKILAKYFVKRLVVTAVVVTATVVVTKLVTDKLDKNTPAED